MQPPEPTYKEYRESGGRAGRDAFEASLPHAMAWLRQSIWPRLPESEAEAEACRRAACAAVDVDAAHGGSGGAGDGASSVSIGSFSMSTSADGGWAGQYRSDMESAIGRELAGTRLRFMGL